MNLPPGPIKQLFVVFPHITYACGVNIDLDKLDDLRTTEERKKFLTDIKRAFINAYVMAESDVPLIQFDYEIQRTN